MKQFSKLLSCLIITPFALFADDRSNDCGVSPTVVARSQARYKMREDVGVADLTNIYNQDNSYGVFSVIPGYMQTIRPGRIAQTLFGSSLVSTTSSNFSNCGNCANECGATILIQGSQVANRTPGAWLADNFYLDPNYNGGFTVKPKIKDFFIDFDYFAGLDEFWCGAYFRVYAPYVHTKWELEYCETTNSNANAGVGYTAGYFDCLAVAPSALLQSFAEYANGGVPTLGTASCATPEGLRFAKINNCNNTRDGLGDLRAELGWNFTQTDCLHVGLNVQAAAPTGTRRRAQFAFAPVVGNGKHWELGGGLTAHYSIWSNEAETEHFGIYLDANVTHLFKAREERTFDLKNKPNSRYMLAAQMGLNNQNLIGGVLSVSANSQFTGVYTPVANLTTLDIRVSTGVQADIVAWFNYSRCGWSFDLGYNFFGRSREHFDCNDLDCSNACGTTSICDANQANTWVLKGDAREYGFISGAATVVSLSASESNATICSGTNATAARCVGGSDDFYNNNCGVDNAQLTGGLALAPNSISLTDNINTSLQPIFINCCDLNFAGTKNITNSVFAHLSYTWDRECWTPFLGIGGFGEFGKNTADCCTVNPCTGLGSGNCNNNDTNNDRNCAGSKVDTSVSRWGVWVKTGVSFN